MQKLFYIFFFISFLVATVEAKTIAKQDIVKKTEDIKYLSQKIANDYLSLYHEPKNKNYKAKLQEAIKQLEDDFRFIARNSNNLETKNILDFLSYTKDQIKESITQDISKESVLDMLDYSDALLEGATFALKKEDKNIKLHLMKISKLYLAINLNFDTNNNKEILKQEIKLLDNSLKINASWVAYKALIKKPCFIPNITAILENDIESGLR